MRSSTYQVCGECVECSAEDCDVVAFCRSEPGWERRQALCDDHWELPPYDEDADPFYDPSKRASDDHYWTTDLANYTESVRTYYQRLKP